MKATSQLHIPLFFCAIFATHGDSLAQVSGTDGNPTTIHYPSGASGNGTLFGRGLALDGDQMAVSSAEGVGGTVNIMEFSGGAWNLIDTLDGSNAQVSGTSVNLGGTLGSGPDSIDFEGNRLLIGSHSATVSGIAGRGAVLLYERANPSAPFSLTTTLTAPPVTGLTPPNDFGRAVSIAGDFIGVGAPLSGTNHADGRAYAFQLISGAWQPSHAFFRPQGTVPSSAPRFGADVAVSGTNMLIGAPFDNVDVAGTGVPSGAVYVADLSLAPAAAQGTLIQVPPPTIVPGIVFGASLDADGASVIIGEPGGFNGTVQSGRAFECQVSANSLTTPFTTLDPGPLLAGNQFGNHVGIQGQRRIVAAPKPGPFNAPIQSFEFLSTANGLRAIALTRTLINPGSADEFGATVAVSSNHLASGAHLSGRAGSSFNGHGAVFAYDRACQTIRQDCQPIANSAGLNTSLAVSGIPSLVAGDLQFSVNSGPSGQFALLRASLQLTGPIMHSGFMGFDCIGANLPIQNPVVQLSNTGTGHFGFATSTLQGTLSAGMTVHFQVVHRDRFAGSSAVNFSDVQSVVMCF